MEKKIIEFHNRYTEIGGLQNKLPMKKGKKNYSEIESEIINKAWSLKNEINEFLLPLKANDLQNDFIKQLDNLLFGLNKIVNDPYGRYS